MHSLDSLVLASLAALLVALAPVPASGQADLPDDPKYRAALSSIMCVSVLQNVEHSMVVSDENESRTVEEICVDVVSKNKMLGQVLEKAVKEDCAELAEVEPSFERIQAYEHQQLVSMSQADRDIYRESLKFCRQVDELERAELVRALPPSAFRRLTYQTHQIEQAVELIDDYGDEYDELRAKAQEVSEIAILQKEEGIIGYPEWSQVRREVNGCVSLADSALKGLEWSEEKEPLKEAFDCVEAARAARVERTRTHKDDSSPLWYAVPAVLGLLLLVGVVYRIRSSTNDVELKS